MHKGLIYNLENEQIIPKKNGKHVEMYLDSFQELAAKKDSLDNEYTDPQIEKKIKSFWTSLKNRAKRGDKQKCPLYS